MQTAAEAHQQELEEREKVEGEIALDLDTLYGTDPDWWREQDAEMTEMERREIEALAEMQEYRTQGYM